jgi:peptide chain release factor 1
MHPKAIELMEKYRELGEELAKGNPASQEYIQKAKERSDMEPFVRKYEGLAKIEADIKGNKEILRSNEDDELKDMAKEEIELLTEKKEKLEEEILFMLLPKDELKGKNIIVEIRSGAGGDEAAIFAGDLFRMYTRYAEIRRWKYEILDFNEIGIGGYKEIVFSIKGKDVYGHLKYESGVHRVQRVPVTESGGRIHTSTASVAVMPEVNDVEVELKEKDLKIDVYRASGAGGQHVNKTDSAVRITHLPTGIVVTCQDERSQLQNRTRAMSILRAKLFDLEYQKQLNAEVEKRRAMIGSGDRAEKIRTYNYPQNRITDHRINLTLYKLEAILNGEMDELINEIIMSEQRQLIKALEN